jgi:hypothetical protein
LLIFRADIHATPHFLKIAFLTKKGKFVGNSAELAWQKLATKLMRVALLRGGATYASLADMLIVAGASETERSVESKIFRGTAKFSFFLQSLSVMNADFPLTWRLPLRGPGDWEFKARFVLAEERANFRRVNTDELCRRLRQFGVEFTPEELANEATAGSFSVAFFMQCTTALGSQTLERYIDLSELDTAAARRF